MVYQNLGTLRVPRSAMREFNRAQKHFSKDSEAERILRHLEHAHKHYTLRIVHNGNDNFNPETRTICWDPYSALRTSGGGKQSPALGLLHEKDHAYENDVAPCKQARLQAQHIA